ncbi:MAG: hypothetical protein ACI9KK_001376 [Ascidiaceihabitans sp.]|jgi:hypothetical protein
MQNAATIGGIRFIDQQLDQLVALTSDRFTYTEATIKRFGYWIHISIFI